MSDERKKPVEKFRSHSVEAAVWFDDEKGFSVSIGKSYRDDKGEWKRSNSYFPNELADLQEVLHRAAETIQKSPQK